MESVRNVRDRRGRTLVTSRDSVMRTSRCPARHFQHVQLRRAFGIRDAMRAETMAHPSGPLRALPFIVSVVGCVLGEGSVPRTGSSADGDAGATSDDPSSVPIDAAPAPSCALQQGSYLEAFTTTDMKCNAIAAKQVTVDAAGEIALDPGCSKAAASTQCSETIKCSSASGGTSVNSTFTLATDTVPGGPIAATGTKKITTTTTISCPVVTIFCPAGYCLINGFCVPLTTSKTCGYAVSLTKQ